MKSFLLPLILFLFGFALINAAPTAVAVNQRGNTKTVKPLSRPLKLPMSTPLHKPLQEKPAAAMNKGKATPSIRNRQNLTVANKQMGMLGGIGGLGGIGDFGMGGLGAGMGSVFSNVFQPWHGGVLTYNNFNGRGGVPYYNTGGPPGNLVVPTAGMVPASMVPAAYGGPAVAPATGGADAGTGTAGTGTQQRQDATGTDGGGGTAADGGGADAPPGVLGGPLPDIQPGPFVYQHEAVVVEKDPITMYNVMGLRR